ncbi:MAG: GNAT family N-acetyltransferase [Ruminococcus sp.]|nr:GNAT family N-acetyltransferase [Ruminococcus sp.]
MTAEMTITRNGEKYTVILSEKLSELPEAAAVRAEVFMDEQGFSAEFDDTDDISVHALLLKNGTSAAVGRAYEDESEHSLIHIGRIAVRAAYRGQGLGSVIVSALEQYAAEKGYTKAVLSAQVRVKGFYESLGYSAEGEEYMDEFCPHIAMSKSIAL